MQPKSLKLWGIPKFKCKMAVKPFYMHFCNSANKDWSLLNGNMKDSVFSYGYVILTVFILSTLRHLRPVQ